MSVRTVWQVLGWQDDERESRLQVAGRRSRAAVPIACVLLVCLCGYGDLFAQDALPRRGLLTLINGDTFSGVTLAGEDGELIGWQGTHFVDPFQFRLGSVRSIKYDARTPEPNESKPSESEPNESGSGESVARQEPLGTFSFELTSGDVIVGALTQWSDSSVQIRTAAIGAVSVRTELLRRMHRIDDSASITFSSLKGIRGWRDLTVDEAGLARAGWDEDGDQLVSRVPGARIEGDLGVPQRAVVDLELSWDGNPDFAIAIAVAPQAGSSGEGGDAAGEQSREPMEAGGWRLETAGQSLVMVREESSIADVDELVDLSNVGRIRLIVYLDQARKTMEVLSAEGDSLGKLSIKEQADEEAAARTSAAVSAPNIRIVNRGESLRLERLQIAKWLGGIPGSDATGLASIALDDGTVVSGRVNRFDSESNRLLLAGTEAGTAMDLSRVVELRLSPSQPRVDPGQCGLFLHDGMRLSGQLIRVDLDHWVIGGDHYLDTVSVPDDLIRTMVVFRSEAAGVENAPVLGRIGRLEMGADRASGRLVPDDQPAQPEALPLRWHPLNSLTSARLRRSVLGKLVYRDPPKIDSQSAAARMLAQQRLRNQQQRRGLNFGELFLQRADLSKASPVKRDAHVIHLRSGDVMACRVDSIDQEGVRVSTVSSERGFVPHERIKAIEFVSNSPPPNLEEAKRQRLLTIPRLQKSAPPSHLLCSHNGDFLRCRVLGTQDEMLRVEVQLEEFRVPRNRIAQIIWFHPDELESVDELDAVEALDAAADQEDSESYADQQPLEADPATSNPMPQAGAEAIAESEPWLGPDYEGLVQVVLNDGKRVTMTPLSISDGMLQGTSQWIGACEFDLGKVDQLLFGDQISVEVADVAYNQWKLQPAVEPLVTAAMQAGDSEPASKSSSLVGNPAPEFSIGLIDGGRFQLSQERGRVVVIDFWASWSASSIQTLALLDQALVELGRDKVRRISINLEEPAEQVMGVLEREPIDALVGLDRDGVVANQYEISVLPQVVLIDAEGNVAGLYVGGGAEMLEPMKATLSDLLGTAPPAAP